MRHEVIPRTVGTHDGSFHADEVTACALLETFDLIDRHKIIRTRNSQELIRCEYVCDVGGIYDPEKNRFDHHQSSYQGELSSAGMVLKELYSRQLLSYEIYHYLNRSFILGVDAVDNGKASPDIGHCSFSAVIANFVPIRHDASPREMDRGFYQAFDFTCGHLNRLLQRFAYIQECCEEVKKEMQKNELVMVFDQSMPWLDSFFELGGEKHPAKFVIMPAGTQWKLRSIPPSDRDRMGVRIPMPANWAGLSGEELRRESKISGAIFCHKGLFISIWETKEDAFQALDYVLEKERK